MYISLDVLGPRAFQKYSIIRYSGHGDEQRPTNRVNLEQVCSLNIEQSRLLQKYVADFCDEFPGKPVYKRHTKASPPNKKTGKFGLKLLLIDFLG